MSKFWSPTTDADVAINLEHVMRADVMRARRGDGWLIGLSMIARDPWTEDPYYSAAYQTEEEARQDFARLKALATGDSPKRIIRRGT